MTTRCELGRPCLTGTQIVQGECTIDIVDKGALADCGLSETLRSPKRRPDCAIVSRTLLTFRFELVHPSSFEAPSFITMDRQDSIYNFLSSPANNNSETHVSRPKTPKASNVFFIPDHLQGHRQPENPPIGKTYSVNLSSHPLTLFLHRRDSFRVRGL